MKILPISNTYPQKKIQQNMPQFKGTNSIPKFTNSIKNIALPTAFALMLMNSTTAFSVKNNSFASNNTELCEMAEKNNLPSYLQKESVQYSKKFEMGDKEYTMYYTDYKQKFSDKDKAVLEIFFVPEDFELHKNGQIELNSPPKLEELIYHNFGDRNTNFVSTVISETTCEKDGSNYKQIFREIVLPEKIGKKLLDLYQGKTKYNLVTGVHTYTETNKKDLMQPIVIKNNGK